MMVRYTNIYRPAPDMPRWLGIRYGTTGLRTGSLAWDMPGVHKALRHLADCTHRPVLLRLARRTVSRRSVVRTIGQE
jgi:hypothetical protein